MNRDACLRCGSKYLGGIDPRTGFEYRYCVTCRPTVELERATERDIRKEQSEADKRRQGSLF